MSFLFMSLFTSNFSIFTSVAKHCKIMQILLNSVSSYAISLGHFATFLRILELVDIYILKPPHF